MEEPIVLRCVVCNIPITNPILYFPKHLPFNTNDGEAHLPQGYYAISDASYYDSTMGHYLVNTSDVINVKNHPDYRRLNGCCGLDGLDGINKVCLNNHELGTECSDCWMAHAITFEPERVIFERQDLA